MTPEEKASKTIFKEWLEKLQQESWQLELLISGFALFAIFSSRVAIQDLVFYSINDVSGSLGVVFGMLSQLIKLGWFIFFINLIIHVLLRGLWIGAIGLRYVSHDIDYDGLNYSERFTKYLKEKVGSFDDYIERLEKMCSVIFSFTFLLFALFMSLIVFFIPIVLFATLIGDFSENVQMFFGISVFCYVGLGLFVLIDLITLGGLKRIKEKNVSKIYFYIYRYYSFITLSFLFRPLLYNFIDNKYTKKLFYLAIPYIFILIVGKNMFENTFNPFLPDRSVLMSSGQIIDDYYYDDLRLNYLQEYPNEERKMSKKLMFSVSLEHYHLRDNYSSLFIKIDKKLIELLEKNKSLKPYKSKGFVFSWFNNNKIDDKEILVLEKEKKDKIAALYKIKKTIRTQYKTNEKLLTQKSDSISKIIEKEEKSFEILISNFEINKAKKTIATILSQYEVSIEGQKIDLKDCFYYYHPHYQEQGLKCVFETDSILKGINKMKIKYKTIRNNGEITKDSIYLPLLKH
jgi:hypothetical protein